MILKSETYHFHRLDLTRQVGFIVTIYDEVAARHRAAHADTSTGVRGGAKGRQQ